MNEQRQAIVWSLFSFSIEYTQPLKSKKSKACIIYATMPFVAFLLCKSCYIMPSQWKRRPKATGRKSLPCVTTLRAWFSLKARAVIAASDHRRKHANCTCLHYFRLFNFLLMSFPDFFFLLVFVGNLGHCATKFPSTFSRLCLNELMLMQSTNCIWVIKRLEEILSDQKQYYNYKMKFINSLAKLWWCSFDRILLLKMIWQENLEGPKSISRRRQQNI